MFDERTALHAYPPPPYPPPPPHLMRRARDGRGPLTRLRLWVVDVLPQYAITWAALVLEWIEHHHH